MLFRRVLFATDFSDVSREALGYVLKLQQAGCREVVLVHVIDERETNAILTEPSGFTEPSGGYEHQIITRMGENAQKELDEVRQSLVKAGFRVLPYLIDGVPAREIMRIADAERVNLIILGSHGKTNLLHILLGSVSENVLRHARQPVLIVRRGYVAGEPEEL